MSKKVRRYPELNALKGRIREMGTSYTKISKELGMSLNTFSEKVNGYYSINADEMQKIAEILDIEPELISHYFMPTFMSQGCKTQHRTG